MKIPAKYAISDKNKAKIRGTAARNSDSPFFVSLVDNFLCPFPFSLFLGALFLLLGLGLPVLHLDGKLLLIVCLTLNHLFAHGLLSLPLEYGMMQYEQNWLQPSWIFKKERDFVG